MRLAEIIAGLMGNIPKATLAVVQKKLSRLLEGDVPISFLFNIARYVTIDHRNVETAVAIDVQETRAEAEHQPAGGA